MHKENFMRVITVVFFLASLFVVTGYAGGNIEGTVKMAAKLFVKMGIEVNEWPGQSIEVQKTEKFYDLKGKLAVYAFQFSDGVVFASANKDQNPVIGGYRGGSLKEVLDVGKKNAAGYLGTAKVELTRLIYFPGLNFFGKYQGGGKTVLINLLTGSKIDEKKLGKIQVPKKSNWQKKTINGNWHFVEKYLSEMTKKGKKEPVFKGKFDDDKRKRKKGKYASKPGKPFVQGDVRDAIDKGESYSVRISGTMPELGSFTVIGYDKGSWQTPEKKGGWEFVFIKDDRVGDKGPKSMKSASISMTEIIELK
ncbi:MAG: hypothetical protein GTO45_29555 [Candidatus Aminicenantes bacterium]|nr:hypothetical protein [Candidatus Aminicenantes bacterium]NIM82940.1 hypothetical protein [Candidatus Aminicenantes bacterium]NIN22317.1 hypothetical protein [Candidatus Aminicenantes bacterium]NIN46085.1 hypothetical protein [Candidatus Aminicenantes bacterium]NIN88921.1 hypothetical protein [Candidatus Aminicenantes bacterium]